MVYLFLEKKKKKDKSTLYYNVLKLKAVHMHKNVIRWKIFLKTEYSCLIHESNDTIEKH